MLKSIKTLIIRRFGCVGKGNVATAPPGNTVVPVITGDVAGEESTTSDGTWTGSPTFTYQWLLNGTIVPTATLSAFTSAVGDAGKTLIVRVTAYNAGGTAIATSAGVVLTEGSAYTGPLDLDSTGILGAYSMRALAAAYVSDAITVKRSVGEETDSFETTTNNAINAAAVTTFINGEDGLISLLFDQSGNTKHLIEHILSGNGHEPTFKASAINSKPSLVFVQAEAPALWADAASTVSSGAVTVYVVGKQSESGADGFLCAGVNASGTDTWDIYVDSSNLVYLDISDGVNSMYAVSSAPVDLTGYFVLDAVISTAAQSLRVNGVNIALDAPTVSGTVGSFSAQLAIGYPLSVSSQTWDGEILEYLPYNGAKSDMTRLSVRQNIADYYGITLP